MYLHMYAYLIANTYLTIIPVTYKPPRSLQSVDQVLCL